MPDQEQTHSAPPPERYVSVKEFSMRSTLCRSSIYQMVKRGEINRPRRLTPKRVGWPIGEVEAWLASRDQSGLVA